MHFMDEIRISRQSTIEFPRSIRGLGRCSKSVSGLLNLVAIKGSPSLNVGEEARKNRSTGVHSQVSIVMSTSHVGDGANCAVSNVHKEAGEGNSNLHGHASSQDLLLKRVNLPLLRV